ncbi:MAG: hypothetical protein JO320_03440 [Alphaproteobacteria bacterium]|nr:hypothetical protein [Alphaproteobacteria bacterium]
MRRLGFLATAALLVGGFGQPALAQCNLGNGIKHIVYIQFDNVHFRRDNPNVPSDLEQMPNLLNFLEQNGAFLTNHWTPLISHTSVDIVTALTGVYGDKFGVSIGNSFGLFNTNGIASSFPSSFTYWTDVLADGLPEMLDQRGKNAPAPWVPFTRAGCDVGAFSIANIEFENVSSDINNVFGANSPQAMEAASNHNKAVADFEGIIVHCAKNSAVCANKGAPDILKDEPGGYVGFSALYGNTNVQPQISPSGPVRDLDGNVIADDSIPPNPGFPGFDPTASQTLGYLATMLEAGVPVVYGYIEDAHDNHITGSGTFGPGEAGYVEQLAAFNTAFGKFFSRLKADGITTANTLFVVTADENDHFVGGPPSPSNCDGVNTPCTYSKLGEIDADLSRLMATETGEGTPFAVHSDDAPTFYISGNPGQLDPITRRFEHEVGGTGNDGQGLTVFNPITGNTDILTQAIADQQEQAFLHMVTADPKRTPNFILFANPDYFLSASGNTTHCVPLSVCSQEGAGFAWNHGDFQPEITNTWLGMAGPGIEHVGQTGAFFTDHTDIRPTIMSLTGLTDNYAHDGRVVIEIMTDEAVPAPLQQHRALFGQLAGTYKNINAPLGTLGMKTLQSVTKAIQANDTTYIGYVAQLKALTGERNTIAGNMIKMMEASEFGGIPFNDVVANVQITLGQRLLASTP